MPDAPPDAKVFMDAPAPNFDVTSCASNPAPTMATAQVTLSGTAQLFNGATPTPIDAALVEACQAGTTCGGSDRLDNDTTDAAGAFTLGPINTSSMPLDAYLRMSKTGVRTMHVFPPQPVQADLTNIPVITFGSTILALACGSQNDATNGIVVVNYLDCTNTPISDSANLVVEIKQGGTPVTGTTIVDVGAQLPQAAGTYLICNVLANNSTSVGATYKGMALRANTIRVVAGTSSSTLVRPGYF